ncbi:MAG: c-type cytochrome domain-containing protein [Bryobacterales bacterium]
MQSRLFRLAGLACLGLAVASAATDPSAAIGILERRCAACHGEGGMSGLDVSTRQALLAGGKRGAAIEPGKPDASLLIQAVDGKHELKMPMGRDALSPEEVETLRTWVQQGASWPEPGAGNAQWWSFQPPVKATLPDATKNPVDALRRPDALRQRPEAFASRRQTHAHPPRLLRPARPAAEPRGGRGTSSTMIRPTPGPS